VNRRPSSWPAEIDAADPWSREGTFLPGPGRPRWVGEGHSLPALHDLARLATDHAPALGNEATDILFGPWSEELDLGLAEHRRLAVVAVAHGALSSLDGSHPAPAEQHMRCRPRPVDPERGALRAVLSAPLAPWRAHRGRLVSLLPGGPVLEEVVVPDVVSVTGSGPSDAVLLARVVRLPVGLVTWGAIALPGGLQVRDAWVEEAAAPGPTLAAALLRTGPTLCRRLHEAAWLEAHGR
jgi:hypothetical protein